MRLNHINLCVDDLVMARDFFQNYFDFRLQEQKGDAVAVMDDGHGFLLVLSNMHAFKSEVKPYPENFHLGFILETSDQVDQAYDRLAAAGLPLPQQPKKVRGSYGFYFTALNDILFEVSCPL
ncbi:VOC family protein [Dictyobacter aurantiacus]|uniref:Glyoxalase n=1 Tax=Dictyobacter aurantiacus TaxID=1936993 RepID=A0A401ZIL4_9CHLR|nr:VOC family protein [Dictyobacter aurantiacus]GCE06687.1 glyoxalase [Dictyobacter aurantiacus]